MNNHYGLFWMNQIFFKDFQGNGGHFLFAQKSIDLHEQFSMQLRIQIFNRIQIQKRLSGPFLYQTHRHIQHLPSPLTKLQIPLPLLTHKQK